MLEVDIIYKVAWQILMGKENCYSIRRVLFPKVAAKVVSVNVFSAMLMVHDGMVQSLVALTLVL